MTSDKVNAGGINSIFNLYKTCFLSSLRNDNAVREIISRSDNRIFGIENISVCIVKKNVIYLLCVHEDYRNKGYGKELLEEAESFISSSGYDRVVVGAGDDYITPGVPMNNGAHEFFIKYGYTHSWGDCGCFDMTLNLEEFKPTHYMGGTIIGVTYRYGAKEDIPEIQACVKDGKPEFLRYYMSPDLYREGGNDRVLLAEWENRVVACIIVSKENETRGSVGCTVTMNAYRNKGIASAMVNIATGELKKQGLSAASLEYTYTDILGLYGKSGYRVSTEYFMAEKQLGNL